MRLLIEIVLAAALIAMAWQKSFKEWVSETPVIGHHLTPTPPTTQNKSSVPPATSATPPASFTGHIYYTDEQGKKYWLDAQGKRHYQP
ncbi:MAG: hypothetical protein DME97_14295 [Verrucomicrobia bacterium]|nr:MAG: hypothetical protein DME97_14295 [Verrucomicrobiota bacterium]